MDMLNLEFTDTEYQLPRDVVFGPQRIRSVAYGVSLKLPNDWMAATILGEVYGIEPLSRSDGLIYVTGRVASIAEILNLYANELDMGFIQLAPVSTPFVDGNTVSIHCSVQGIGVHNHAYVTTVTTPRQNAITFAALFDEAAAFLFRGVASELADSVEDLPW
jgi:hypothetical protein